MHLYLANKLYSSWSMRPWLMMRTVGIAFDESVIPLREPDTKARILEVSPSGKLPVLVHDDGTHVWDSMAIISWLSDLYPEKPIWPEGLASRGHAKAISLEMHAGFQALRQACPMNLGKRFKVRDFGPDVAADVVRVCEIWRETRAKYGGGGPFLFGQAFTAPDAMYAPVVNRLAAYQLPVDDEARAYMQAVQTYWAYEAWLVEALKEPWRIAAYEEGHVPEVEYLDYAPGAGGGYSKVREL